MYISYNWLRELCNTAMTPYELRERLTMAGLAVDAIKEVGDDYVLDVEIPSNRPDCLSHVGIAREVAVIEGLRLQIPSGKPPKVKGRTESFTSVEIQDADLCPRYAARIVRGVKIAPSPEWLAKRLQVIGQRPINNVADITNYVLHELGQPLHAFDLARLAEQRILIRRARADEKLKTLDGAERKLDSEMLVIADAARAVALAGVMGGEDSEISNQTTDVLIESAYFNPDSVRRTARKLGMDTEASRRFERGADYDAVLKAQERCVNLICEIAGGVATENPLDIYEKPMTQRPISFRPSRVEALTSLCVATPEMSRIFAGLGFAQANGASAASQNIDLESATTLIAPTWRVDIEREEDLVEEIARHSGYDKISSELPASSSSGEYQPEEMKRRAVRRAVSACGFDEAISLSFIKASDDDRIELIPDFVHEDRQERFVTLKNPIIEEASRMRATLLPGLLEAVRHNFNHGIKDVRLFEIGRIFAVLGELELPNEREAFALVATGGAIEEHRARAERETDFYDIKGALESAIDVMKLSPVGFQKTKVKHLRAGQSATISLGNGRKIGTIGRLSESIAGEYKFRHPIYVAELDFTALLLSGERVVQYKQLPRYPSVVRDITLLVDRSVTPSDLLQALNDRNIDDCRGAKLVGVYQGSNIPETKRSITLRIEYRSDDRTLRDEEVEERHRALVAELVRNFQAELH
jgi:phenylalanyl-tRNA synthetase beta chain